MLLILRFCFILSVIRNARTQSFENDFCKTDKCIRDSLIKTGDFNNSAPCGDSFYRFSCGGWLDSFQLPKSEARWTYSFSSARNRTEHSLQEILDNLEPQKCTKEGIKRDKWNGFLRCYYDSCLDSEMRERNNIRPLLSLIEEKLPFLLHHQVFEKSRLSRPYDEQHQPLSKTNPNFPKRLAERVAAFTAADIPSFFLATPATDSLSPHPRLNLMHLWQSGLGLNYAEYDQDPKVEAYRNYISKILEIVQDRLGTNFGTFAASTTPVDMAAIPVDIQSKQQSQLIAERVIDFERKLRKFTMGPEKMTDPSKRTNKVDFSEIQDLIPLVDLKRFFKKLVDAGLLRKQDQEITKVITHSLEYFNSLNTLIENIDIRVIEDYFLVQTLLTWSHLLDAEFRDATDEYFRKIRGTEPDTLKKQCLKKLIGKLGWILGREYIKGSKNTKKVIDKMTTEIRKEFQTRVLELDWMDAATKKAALEKESLLRQAMSHPKWLEDPKKTDYWFTELFGEPQKVPMTILTQSSFDFEFYLMEIKSRFTYKSLNRPVTEEIRNWMTPSTVNAFYSRDRNLIGFPAGILKPPFVLHDEKYSISDPRSALSWGSIGVIIGHELSHAYDWGGSQYTGTGVLKNWWSERTRNKFNEKTQCLVRQFSDYVMPDVNISLNGKLTLNENIADQGGLLLAYRAMKRVMGAEKMTVKPIEGLDFTAEQLFFLSFGQTWCSKATKESQRSSLGDAYHSPGRFRAVGTVRNHIGFAKAFGCPVKKEDMCIVW